MRVVFVLVTFKHSRLGKAVKEIVVIALPKGDHVAKAVRSYVNESGDVYISHKEITEMQAADMEAKEGEPTNNISTAKRDAQRSCRISQEAAAQYIKTVE